jgi:hypothetical protein
VPHTVKCPAAPTALLLLLLLFLLFRLLLRLLPLLPRCCLLLRGRVGASRAARIVHAAHPRHHTAVKLAAPAVASQLEEGGGVAAARAARLHGHRGGVPVGQAGRQQAQQAAAVCRVRQVQDAAPALVLRAVMGAAVACTRRRINAVCAWQVKQGNQQRDEGHAGCGSGKRRVLREGAPAGAARGLKSRRPLHHTHIATALSAT